MLRVSSLLSFCALLFVFSICDSAVAAPFSSPSEVHSRLLSSLRHYKTLSAPDPTTICSDTYGCLPADFPVPDPSTVQYVQFPNGESINLQGFGTASLPYGYPEADLPSYNSQTNTITDPVVAAIFAYSLSTQANPDFNANDWNGITFPTNSGTSLTGVGNIGGSSNTNTNTNGIGNTNTNSNSNGNVGGTTGTGTVVNGGSATGSPINSNPNSGSGTTGTNSNGNTNGGTTTTNGNGGTTTNNGNGGTGTSSANGNGNGGTTTTTTSNKNGASALVGSLSLVAGLAVATIFAAVL